MTENHREGEGGETHSLQGMFLLLTLGTDHSWGSRGVRCLALCLWPCGGRLRGSKINHICHTRVSGDELRGWEAVRFYSPSPHYRELGHAILTFLKPGLIAFWGRGALTQSGSVGECLRMGQFTSQDSPESDHQDIGTAPSDFLSHFVTWKKVVYLHIYLKSAQGHT